MVKVDCHLHTKYSKNVDITHSLSKLIGAKESYLEPETAYQTAKDRGMDFVAITDHDTIEGALILNEEHDDIIIGEELEVKASNEGHLVHLLVYSINEKHHKDLTDLKKIGLKETGEYIRKNDIVHSLAHVSYKASNHSLDVKIIDEWMKHVDCLEIINGDVAPVHNKFARVVAFLYGKNVSGGSDAHVKMDIAKTYTVANKAKTKDEFLQALKKGDVIVEGDSCRFFDSLKTGYILTGQSFYDVLLNPIKRERKAYQKYFLDYIVALCVVIPTFLAVVPGIAIAHSHQKSQEKETDELKLELLDYLSKKFYGSLDKKTKV